MVQYETERLVMRDYRLEDLPEHHRLMSDRENMYFLDDIAATTMEDSRENLVFAMQGAGETPRKYVFLAMTLRETGAYLGSVGYTVEQTTPVGKVVHMGYFMLADYKGRGYMTEAVRGLMEYAFLKDGVYRMNTGCFADNKPSERVMQKCGMIKEGEYPKAQWHDGKMKDRLAYRMLKEEWGAWGTK